MMTNEQKIEALSDLLDYVIFSLSMKQYVIEDATEAHQCEVEADQYHQKMIDILHNEEYVETFFGTPITEEQADELDAYLDTLGESN